MGQRVPVSGRDDEVDQLAGAFNAMLERIDRLVEGIRDATDTLAHDIRTPISGIRGMAEVTLRSQRDPSAYRMALYQITEQMDRLLSLSNTILDVSEAEAGALALRLEPVALEDLVNEAVQMFCPVAVETGVSLSATLVPGVTVEGDRGRLGQVLANLLDNAIKFTPSCGHIQIDTQPANGNGEIVISVADTGPGIAEKDLPHIFERYYKAEKSNSGNGAGLGLPLVQGIMKAHGGRVTVESNVGEGTVFRLFLPAGGSPS
jgi:signal transduction histidine kinase